MTENTIKNQWCVYGDGFFLWGVGKIVKENAGERKSVEILYSEGQLYQPELWDSNYVKRFDTLKKATEYYLANSPEPRLKVIDRINGDFPSEEGLENIVSTPLK